MGHQIGLVAVKLGAPIRDAALIVFGGGGGLVGAVHLGRQGAELGQGDVGGAAFGAGGRVARSCGKAGGAFLGQIGDEDVRRGVQVVLRVAADQLMIGGKGHVAFQNACAHARGGDVGLHGVLRKHQRRATVADGEIGFGGVLPHAGGQLVLQCALGQPVHQIGRTGAVFDRGRGSIGLGQRHAGREGQSGERNKCSHNVIRS